jgi:hypothetical protein
MIYLLDHTGAEFYFSLEPCMNAITLIQQAFDNPARNITRCTRDQNGLLLSILFPHCVFVIDVIYRILCKQTTAEQSFFNLF